MIEFVVKKGAFGGFSVVYSCPRCSSGLKSRLDEAGKSDTCPDCGVVFVIPGKEECDRIRREQVTAAQKQSHEKEALRRERETKREQVKKQAAMRAANLRAH